MEKKYMVRHWFFLIATTENITKDRENSMADPVRNLHTPQDIFGENN